MSPGRSRGWLMRRLLVVADVVGLLAAFSLALAMAPAEVVEASIEPRWEVALFVASLPLWILTAHVLGLYGRDEERASHSTVDDLFGLLQLVSLGTWGVVVAAELLGLPYPHLGRLVIFWVLALLLLPLARAVARVIGRRHAAYVQRVIIVGSGYVARLLATKIAMYPEFGLRVVGFVDRDGDAPLSGVGSLGRLGGAEDLERLVVEHRADRVLIAFSIDSHEETLGVIRSLQDTDVVVDIVPRMFEVLGTNAKLHSMHGIPLVGLPAPKLSPAQRVLKRSLDLMAAVTGLILLAPLFGIVAVAITLDSRGSVFFRQTRMGAGERVFWLYKFRTMVEDAESRKAELVALNMHGDGDPRMFKAPNDPRITRVGAVLRRWRLDELPQLLNVLRGEMSIVGPRPLVLDEDRHVEAWARRRLNVKPGMTGLWQVLGASDIPFGEMTKLDYLYVTNWTLREDLRLIALTLPALFRPRAAY
jgi:exopolysaccharide biosynthesis polyprenyl glycosylphosphotransferase